MSKKNNKLVVFTVALLASLCFQGSRGLYDRDETRYSECAREMLITGSWMVPLRDFRPHLTKPPLAYWSIALGLKAFGVNEWGARIPNALAFAITVLLVGLISDRLFEKGLGPLASTVYLTSLAPFAASNILTTDTMLVMWEVAAVWAFVAGFRANTKNMARIWFAVMGLFWGLGFLTKGPAICPVAAAMGIFWLCRRSSFKASPVSLSVILIFLIAGLSWYMAIIEKYPWAGDLILEEQVTGRLFSDVFHRNSSWYAPFYLYLPMIVFGSMPWTFNLFKFLKHSIRTTTPGQVTRKLKTLVSRDPAWLFLILWWAVPLLIFSLARSRLPLYILPLFPAMAIATARILFLKALSLRAFTAKAVITLGVFLMLKAAAALIPAPQDARAMYTAFSPYIENENDIDAIDGPFLDGLAFYTGKQIEYLPENVGLSQSRPIDSSWNEEVQEIRKRGGNGDVFVLDSDEKSHFQLIKQLGLEARLLKRFYEYGLYNIRPMENGPCSSFKMSYASLAD